MRLALLLLAACATTTGPLRDSPQFLRCRQVCADAGMFRSAVVEDDDGFTCLCRGNQWHDTAPKPTTRIDWREVEREIALAALRTDLEFSIRRNREAFEQE